MAIDFQAIKDAGIDVDIDAVARAGFDAIDPSMLYRLKTYGICTQKAETGAFMLRVRIPAGALSSIQLRRLADLGEADGSGVLHLTTRQDVELHDVVIERVPAVLTQLAEVGLTTRSACGHTIRNVMACEDSGLCPDEVFDVRPWAHLVSDHLVSRSVWLNNNLPRRLNIYFAACPECEHHALVNDIAFVARPASEPSFEVYLGGSLGTSPYIARKVNGELLPARHAVAACEAVAAIYIAHGDRKVPTRGRLKFLVEAWGWERFERAFRDELEVQAGTAGVGPKDAAPLAEPTRLPIDAPGLEASFRLGGQPGLLPQKQPGYLRLAVQVPIGDMTCAQARLVAGIMDQHGDGSCRVSRQQNLEIPFVPADRGPDLMVELNHAGLMPFEAGSAPDVMSCVGTTYCKLALTDSQGAARAASAAVADAGELATGVRIHISGCPNNCAQHSVADIGFQGGRVKGEESYQLYLGGRLRAGEQRLANIIPGKLLAAEVGPTVSATLDAFRVHRREGESFSQFYDRVGPEVLSIYIRRRMESP
jgi:sulfite reductase beta subunit-like hemoprotein